MRLFVLSLLLLVGCGTRNNGPPIPIVNDAGDHPIGSMVPGPQGPAGGVLGGTYPNPHFESDAMVLSVPRGGTGLNGPGSDGGTLVSNGASWVRELLPPGSVQNGDGGEVFTAGDGGPYWRPLPTSAGLVAIDAGTKNQLPESRLVACTNGLSIVAVGGVETCQLVALDGGTTGLLAPSRIAPISSATAQVLTTNAVPSTVWQTPGGDLSMSATAQFTVTKAQGGQTGELDFGSSTGTINGASTATSVGLSQSSTTSATAANMVDTPQTSSNASGTTGNRVFNFAVPTSATAVTPWGRIIVQSAGTNQLELGYDPFWGPSIFLGTASTSNAALYGTSTTTNLNASSAIGLVIGGSTFALHALGASSETVVGSGFNFSLSPNSLGGDYGGGSPLGVFGLKAATTAPSSAPTTAGDSVVWSDTGGFKVETNTSGVQTLTSSVSGTHSSQVLSFGDGPREQCTTTQAGTCVLTVPIPTGSTCHLDLRYSSYVTSSSGGTVGGLTVGDVWESDSVGCALKNVAGTAGTIGGSSCTPVTIHDTSQVGNSCAGSFSSGNFVATCTTLSTNGILKWLMEISRMDCN